jgi:pimeloyl-ACP methyl ester carboxylesterase
LKRRWKVLIGVAVALGALLAVNTAVIDSETKPAGVTADGGRILELSSVDMQIVDRPAANAGKAGEGAPIVLLHCYACSLHWWDQLVPLINRDHRVITLDLVGFGGSQKPKSGYSIPEQARAVSEALNGLGVQGAVLVGHSMGGDVATAVAEGASELVNRVAVIGTPSTSEQAKLPFVGRLAYVPVIGEALWRLRPDSLIRSGYESAFASGFDFETAFTNPDQVVEDNRAMTYTSFDSSAAEADRFSDEGTIAARITATGVPFLAILGSEDQIVDTPAAAESFEAVPGATVQVLEGVGHSANLEAPSDTAELLLRFGGAAPGPAALAAAARAQARAERRAEARVEAARERAKKRARRRARKAAKAEQQSGKRNGKGKGGKSGGKGG